MSAGTKYLWQDAATIAKRLHTELEPVVLRAQTVGSLRRRRAEVGDVEFLLEPKTISDGLFGEEKPDTDAIYAVARTWGNILKGGEKMIQVEMPDGLHVELWVMTAPAQWGSLLAIRTGPAELGRHAVSRMRDRGYFHVEGHVIDEKGDTVPTPEEADFFRIAGLDCLPPHRRDEPAAFRPKLP